MMKKNKNGQIGQRFKVRKHVTRKAGQRCVNHNSKSDVVPFYFVNMEQDYPNAQDQRKPIQKGMKWNFE